MINNNIASNSDNSNSNSNSNSNNINSNNINSNNINSNNIINNIFQVFHPEVFHLNNLLNSNNSYFEGWYFKCTCNAKSISFIPGISISKNNRCAFIQVITNTASYYIPYNVSEFSYTNSPFSITIQNNYFSLDKIKLNIQYTDLKISGILKFSNLTALKKSLFSPNIMGPFSYIPYMECNHAILSMKHTVNGCLTFNGNLINFDNGIGYIEKDFGLSFPKSYIWCEGNSFKNNVTASMSFSVAKIPLKLISFTGFICALIIDGIEYRFTSYNNSKIEKIDINDNIIMIILKKSNLKLTIQISGLAKQKFLKLKSPKLGQMKKKIFESLSSEIHLTLLDERNIIFNDTSSNCGLEIVK